MTLTEDNDQPEWFSPDDPRGELAKLVTRRDLLVRALRETEDPAARADLAYQLRVASQQIEAISWASDVDQTPGDHQLPAAVTADLPSSGLPDGTAPNGLTHADVGHADVGHDDFGHADVGHADVGHAGVDQDDFFGHDQPGSVDMTAGGFDPDGSPSDDRIDSAWPPPQDQQFHEQEFHDQGLHDSTFAETMAEALAADPATADEGPPPVEDDLADDALDWDQRATIDHSWAEVSVHDPAEPSRYEWPDVESRMEQPAPNLQPVDHQFDSRSEPDEDGVEHPANQHQHPDHRYPDQTPGYEESDGVLPAAGLPPVEYESVSDPGLADAGHPDPGFYDPGHPDPGLADAGHPDPGFYDPGQEDRTPLHDPHQPQPVVDSLDPVGTIGPAHWPASDSAGSRGGRGGDRPGGGRRNTEPRHAPITDATAEPAGRNGFVRPSGPVLAVVGVSLALLAGVLWFGDSRRSDQQAGESIAPASPQAAPLSDGEGETVLTNVRAVLQGLGLGDVSAELRDGVIHLIGPVPTQAAFDSASNAVRTVADTYPVDTSALVVEGGDADPSADASVQVDERAKSLQTELDRILASTPLIFGPGQAELSELHRRILNNAIIALQAYPGFIVTIAGFTDDQGDEAQNRQLSLTRAENVRAYLVEQGLASESFTVEARGEDTASGSSGLAGLERRVEFEVEGASQPPGSEEILRVAIVAPSASNDLAFTQSMVDAVNAVAAERPIELAVTDNTFVPDDAAAAVRGYAEQGFDLVIAHGSQFGSALLDIAPQYPETAFAWGTASDTFGQPNVYAYDAAAQEGGYVMGAMAGLLSQSSVIGVIGPIEVGDAAQYVSGFDAGARAEVPAADVRISYTGSFSDIGLASEAAQAHLGAGADVLTGSAQMVVGAIAAAEQPGALWFGTQSNQASLAPSIVVASQVYHWEAAIREILADVEAGTLNGTTYTANLANGGLAIEFNPDYPLSPEVRQRADQLSAAIANGSVIPPG